MKRAAEERHDLPGFDGGDGYHPLYVLVDAPQKYHPGDVRSAARDRRDLKIGDTYQTLHVVSRPQGGEVRGYVLANGLATLRTPAYPAEWAEVDAAVAAVLGVEVRS